MLHNIPLRSSLKNNIICIIVTIISFICEIYRKTGRIRVFKLVEEFYEMILLHRSVHRTWHLRVQHNKVAFYPQTVVVVGYMIVDVYHNMCLQSELIIKIIQ